MEKETVDEGLSTDPDHDDLGYEGQNSAAIGLRSILDGLWVPCLLEHAYTSSSLSLETCYRYTRLHPYART
jgi:hypothetical protein